MMRNFAVFGLVAGRYFWLARGAAMTLATSENWSLSIVASLSWPPQLPPFPKAYNSGWNEPSGSLVRTLSLLTLEDTAVTPSMASAARALVGASNPNVTARTHGIMGCVFIAGLKGGTRARRSRAVKGARVGAAVAAGHAGPMRMLERDQAARGRWP